MVFEFEVRDISKKEIKKFERKYSKQFKKENSIKVVCELFMELIYLYFDNDKEKLFKLFFPVIMANFIENGSIHSVIAEYREKNRLYSYSYTYRILAKLNAEIGMGISRIFRKILFNILKQCDFRNQGYCVAIDITAKPFYGNKNLLMVKGCKKKAGTNYAIQYMTASIIEEGVRFNLLCCPIHSLASLTRIFENLTREIRKTISIKLLFLDRGFGNKKYSRIINQLRHKFIMPITKNKKLKELELCIAEQSILENDEHDIVSMDYIFGEDLPKEYQQKVRLIIIHDKDGIYFFITNMYGLGFEDYYSLCKAYKYRFGIETNYRMDNIFSPLTTSIKAAIRYLHMQISLMMEDLWTMVNFLGHSKDKKQPREQYKGDCSIINIVKARIKELDFIWRPLITAVQFKRKAERILG